jgi:hypothetical protein
MADSVLFIGWGAPVRGREQNAAKVFGEAVELWSRLQADGTLESWSAYFLEPHGGDLQGFFLLQGEREKLALAHERGVRDRDPTCGHDHRAARRRRQATGLRTSGNGTVPAERRRLA